MRKIQAILSLACLVQPVRSRQKLLFFPNRVLLPFSSMSKNVVVDSLPMIQNYLNTIVQPALSEFNPEKKYHFYLGNEASDADSIISALTWACISHYTDHDSNNVHIPFVAVPKAEFELRPETKLLLSDISVNMQSIPSLADFSSQRDSQRAILSHKNKLNLILLDHNQLSEKAQAVFQDSVISIRQILDHHQDFHFYEEECQDSQRLIEFNSTTNKALVASTCTIVYEQLKNLLATSSSIQDSPLIREISHVLLGVILLDSLNMDPKAAKGTTRDAVAIEELRSLLQWSEAQRTSYFERLFSAKTSELFWDEISLLNCFKFDYKMFLNELQTKRVGYSSVLLPIDRFLKKASLAALSSSSSKSLEIFEQISDFYHRVEQLDLLIVLSFHRGQRELLLISTEKEAVKKLGDKLLAKEDIQLSPLDIEIEARVWKEAGFHCLAFHQGNLTYSRKQLAPIISQLVD